MEKTKKNTEEKKNNKKIENLIFGIVIVVALVLAVLGLWKLSGEGDKPSNTLVFTIGSEEVYLDEVNFCILQNVLNLGITAESMQGVTAEDGTDAASYYKQEILDLIMEYKVEYLMAKEQGITMTEEEEKQVRNDAVKYLGQIDARLLNQWGIDQDIVYEVYRQRYLASQLEQTVIETVEVDDQKYCTIYMLLFPKIEMQEDGNYVAQEDGVTPIMLSDTDIQKRKEDANQALIELKDGAEIEAIAQKYGVENYSSTESNMTGSFGEPFTQYAESLKAGEYSPVLETESCYAIIKMITENNEALANEVMKRYRADVAEEMLLEKRIEWREQLGVGQTPEFNSKIWEKISLYDYVQ